MRGDGLESKSSGGLFFPPLDEEGMNVERERGVWRRKHAKASNADDVGLSKAMSACDSLSIDSGVPAGREEVDMGEHVKVEPLGISTNLENEDVKSGSENGVPAVYGNASVKNVNKKPLRRESVPNEVDFSREVAEDEFAARMVVRLGEAQNVLDECTGFSRTSWRRSDLGARVVGEELNVWVHGGVERADLPTTDKRSKRVCSEEPGTGRDAFSLGVSEVDRSVEFSSEVSLQVIVPGDVDVLNNQRWQLEPDIVLGATKDTRGDECPEDVAPVGVGA